MRFNGDRTRCGLSTERVVLISPPRPGWGPRFVTGALRSDLIVGSAASEGGEEPKRGEKGGKKGNKGICGGRCAEPGPGAPPVLTMAAARSGAFSQHDAEAVDVRDAAEPGGGTGLYRAAGAERSGAGGGGPDGGHWCAGMR